MKYLSSNGGDLIFILTLMNCPFRSCCNDVLIFYVGSNCGSLRGSWRWAGISGFDSAAYFSSKLFGFCTNDIRVDDWG